MAVALALARLATAGCTHRASAERAPARAAVKRAAFGNPTRGKALIRQYGCVSCHTIPGVRGAQSVVGPPLAGFAKRTYVAGVLVNQPANLVRFIRNPPGVDTLTAMPNLGVTERHARDIASFLYTLK